MIYELKIPTRVIMGQGVSNNIADILKEYNVKKVLCVYDVGIKKIGLADGIVASVKDAGIETVIFDEVVSDPPDTLIAQIGELGLEASVDGVLAIGGGSTLDAAKGANVLIAGNPGPINQYLGKPVTLKPGKPIFTVPTTSGTGAEVSHVAVITESEKDFKNAVFNEECCRPAVAIVDPELIVGLPAGLTASTGADTLAHAVEAYTNSMQDPLSDPIAERSIELVGKYLERAVADGKDIEAREGMCQACTLAAIAFGHTSLHLCHGFGTPFGGRFHIQHGTACGIFLPCTLEYIAGVRADRIRKVGLLLGMDVPEGLSDIALAESVADYIRALLDRISFPTLKELGIKESDFDVMVQDVLEDIAAVNCPRPLDRDALKAVLVKEYTAR